MLRVPVDGVDEAFLMGVNGHVDIGIRMSPVDQYRRSAGRQPLLNAQRVGHPHGHVVEPRAPPERGTARRTARADRRGERSTLWRTIVPRNSSTAADRSANGRSARREACGICAITPQSGASRRLV